MKNKESGPAIARLATSVYDNGRRGMPRPGCDCVQCFGYCLIDKDAVSRAASEGASVRWATRSRTGELDFK